MRPLFRSLFVFSVFGVMAAHVSTGFLQGLVSDVAPLGVSLLDKGLNALLIRPLGPVFSICVLLGIGAFFSLWTFMSAKASGRSGPQERYSTW